MILTGFSTDSSICRKAARRARDPAANRKKHAPELLCLPAWVSMIDHRLIALFALSGAVLDALGSLYLAYDLLGGQ
jgi:hypothetical protein